jgi:four helix bundle protein
MRDDKENLIVKLSFEFALKIIEFSEELEAKKKYVIARQLIKSGTSIGANVHEAQNAESKADFIHKLKIAAKEADETEYWLKLCEAAESYPSKPELNSDLLSIIKVLSKIIGTSKRNPSSNQPITKLSN